MKPFRTAPIEVLHEKFVYDASTGLLHCKATGRTLGNFSKGYLKVSIKGASISVHRVAWAMHYGEWPTLELDHKDQDKSNNRIDNLRQATRGQNVANVGSFGAVSSKGVSYDARFSKFRALIKDKGVSRNIGYFETEDEAAHAYNKEAIRVHGEFAVLNPIGLQPTDFDRLFETGLDTTKENSKDWIVRGGPNAGEGSALAKLTKEQVLIIRDVYAARTCHKWGATRLAKKFGVSMDAVRLAATGGTWSGLERVENNNANKGEEK